MRTSSGTEAGSGPGAEVAGGQPTTAASGGSAQGQAPTGTPGEPGHPGPAGSGAAVPNEADAPPGGPGGAASGKPGDAAGGGVPERPAAMTAELEALRAELDEHLKDLQRVTAEYANYRKRVERDRIVVVEQAAAGVIAAMLPILDDLDRAREHGDLVGPFGAVAESLTAALGKFGLNAFGEPGDTFDPTRHEAVTHQKSADVTVPTCVAVMRRGYLLGERLLRAALVAVADPE
jgi:molecular chaperone GrpE